MSFPTKVVVGWVTEHYTIVYDRLEGTITYQLRIGIRIITSLGLVFCLWTSCNFATLYTMELSIILLLFTMQNE